MHNCGLHAVERIERGVLWQWHANTEMLVEALQRLDHHLHDRMTQLCLPIDSPNLLDELITGATETLFSQHRPRPLQYIKQKKLAEANQSLGLALSNNEIAYLQENIQRDLSNAELMMFSQINSEHCRHKIFNAAWQAGGELQPHTLFDMIRNTHRQHPGQVLVAYSDNAAVMYGHKVEGLVRDFDSRQYFDRHEDRHILMKVETHNHPTAISPHPGASTGAGGEIRDEAATGRGSTFIAGLMGFSVSNLNLPDAPRPWEGNYGKPGRIASALDIMLQGPIGASAFNNEFGRPNLCGYFRSFEQTVNGRQRGYHKPIMLAGGMGSIASPHIYKKALPAGAQVIVLGGPSMLIGLGGGAASSMASGQSDAELDFASVQRGNPEMQRRCQEVINVCTELAEQNPILSIHDVGAGGLSNAVPEILDDSERGGIIKLRSIPTADPGLSPMEIWCNESQERYVLVIQRESLALFGALCARERCPYAAIGEVTERRQLLVIEDDGKPVIDLSMPVLLGKLPQMQRRLEFIHPSSNTLNTQAVDLYEAAFRVLQLPTVASKQFLITIGDRSVTGLVTRDQMIGPWQVPVADCAVTAADYHSQFGEAMAVGERTPTALLNPAASARLAIAEALTNLAAARIDSLEDIALSANWMAACGHPTEDSALFEAVRAVGLELCAEIGIAIPVGKDSLSMHTTWEQGKNQVTSPMSLIISAFARVADINKTLTPLLDTSAQDTVLVLLDLGRGRNRLGGSALAQVYEQIGDVPADLDYPADLKQFFTAVQTLNASGQILAYHDRSDGGLFVTLCEMAFATHCGLDLVLQGLGESLAVLFNEEPGAVIQIRKDAFDAVKNTFGDVPCHLIGEIGTDSQLTFTFDDNKILQFSRTELHQAWHETSYHIQKLRDNPDCAESENNAILDETDPGLSPRLTFELAPVFSETKPRLAILREQGVNGHLEMAAAFMRAGFECVDVHMTDIIGGNVRLANFQGLAACGGFSYGDVLGAGGGWARSVRYNPRAFDEFSEFFNRPDSFALGVCNGCQMMAQLRDMIPGAAHWPVFARNLSEQFEARLSLVEITKSPSLFLSGMAEAHLPVVIAHGEGRTFYADTPIEPPLIAMQYIDNYGEVSENYPVNPNGSPQGITGVTTPDGRFTIMMPHPERIFLNSRLSWKPADWTD
ncbi:MAG: phosphoribosylformylglycinamidine synthase, partial [Pseudomonadota bacterium]